MQPLETVLADSLALSGEVISGECALCALKGLVAVWIGWASMDDVYCSLFCRQASL